MLGLAKCVPRGEAQGALTITTASSPAPLPTAETERLHYRENSPLLSLQEIEILSAPCCDCLQFRMCCIRCAQSSCRSSHSQADLVLHTCEDTYGSLHYTHTHNTRACSPLCGNSPVSWVCEGLFSFESETGGDFMDRTHTHSHARTDSLC